MKILKEMTIGEIVRNYPESVEVLMNFGMGCIGCPSAQAETIEEACRVHGIDVEKIIKSLNEGLTEEGMNE
ncbi:MAG: DUF1858 domain-containing protein [Bacillota bacterium]|nr:DUF1858 domain-containing protein [Bacillota bacterium]